jgi:hypothetical protein
MLVLADLEGLVDLEGSEGVVVAKLQIRIKFKLLIRIKVRIRIMPLPW